MIAGLPPGENALAAFNSWSYQFIHILKRLPLFRYFLDEPPFPRLERLYCFEPDGQGGPKW